MCAVINRLVFHGLVRATATMEQPLSTDDESSIEIQNVEYDYSMFADRDRMDCTGTLKFTVTVDEYNDKQQG